MRHRFPSLAAALVVAASLGLVPVLTASAHAVINAGRYRVAIGWQVEPASGAVTYVDQPNAIQVFVDADVSASNPTGTPVSTLNADCAHPELQVTVSVGPVTSSPFCPAPVHDPDTNSGRLDEYGYPLTPTAVGTYTLHIFGSIEGTSIDKTITSGQSTFDSVGDQTAIEFPVAVPAAGDLATQVDRVNQRATQALATARSASNASSGAGAATGLAIAALIVALLLGGTNLALLARRVRG